MIFALSGVFDPEAAIFDVPATTPPAEQCLGGHLMAVEAGDRVADGDGSFALTNGLTFEAKQLLGTRPVDAARRDGGQRSFPEASATLLDGLCLLAIFNS